MVRGLYSTIYTCLQAWRLSAEHSIFNSAAAPLRTVVQFRESIHNRVLLIVSVHISWR